MYGKVFGAMLGGGIGLLLAWDPLIATGLGLVGLVIGHLVIDREPAVPRVEAPRSVDELLQDDPPRPRSQPAKPRRKPAAPEPPPMAEHAELAKLLCAIFIEVARVDGPVSQPEVRVVREFFQFDLKFGDDAMEAVRLALKTALGGPKAELEPLVKAARAAIKPAARLDVVRSLYDLALVDGELRRSESDALKIIVQHFNLSEEALKEITTRFFGQGSKHYDTLGITDAATDDEIRSAFKRLASESHPDRVASLGPKEAEEATARFREIKDAYEELRKIRGF